MDRRPILRHDVCHPFIDTIAHCPFFQVLSSTNSYESCHAAITSPVICIRSRHAYLLNADSDAAHHTRVRRPSRSDNNVPKPPTHTALSPPLTIVFSATAVRSLMTTSAHRSTTLIFYLNLSCLELSPVMSASLSAVIRLISGQKRPGFRIVLN